MPCHPTHANAGASTNALALLALAPALASAPPLVRTSAPLRLCSRPTPRELVNFRPRGPFAPALFTRPLFRRHPRPFSSSTLSPRSSFYSSSFAGVCKPFPTPLTLFLPYPALPRRALPCHAEPYPALPFCSCLLAPAWASAPDLRSCAVASASAGRCPFHDRTGQA